MRALPAGKQFTRGGTAPVLPSQCMKILLPQALARRITEPSTPLPFSSLLPSNQMEESSHA